MATVTSIATGLASAGATWDAGSSPVEGDKVVIAAGHVVTLDSAYVWGDDSTTAITVNGTLKASRTASSSLTAKGNVIINSGGYLDYGADGDAIPSGVDAFLILNYSAALAACKYGLETAGANPKMTMWGKPRKRNAKLTAEAASGQPDVTVDDVTGWAAGDTIVLHAPDDDRSHSETLTISSIAGTTVTMTGNLARTHASGSLAGNFTSNVKVYPHNTSYAMYVGVYWNASATEEGTINFDNVLFGPGGNNGSTLKYGALGIWPVNDRVGAAVAKCSGISNCAFFGNDGCSTLTVSTTRYRVVSTGCCFFNKSTYDSGTLNAALYLANGGVSSHDDFVIYRGCYGVTSTYGAGGVSIIMDDSYLLACSRPLNLTSIFGLTMNRCYFGHDRVSMEITNGSSIIFNECDIGVSFPYTGGTLQLFSAYQPNSLFDVTMNGCMFADGDIISTSLPLSDGVAGTVVKIANKNVDPLEQYVYMSTGSLSRDNTFSRDPGGSSLKMEPTSSADWLEFPLNIFAPEGYPIVVSGYIYMDDTVAGDPPEIELSGLGTSDTWTADNTADTWQQFKVAVTQESGADGMLTLTVRAKEGCNVWVDGLSAPTPVAVASGEFGYWANGLPAPIATANYVAAADVWNVLTSALTLDGSIGKKLATTVPGQLDDIQGIILSKE